MNVNEIVSQAQSLRHQAKSMLEAATVSDQEQVATSVAFGNAPILFPKPEAVILAPNAQGTFGAAAKPSRNAPLEKIALELGEVYARLETAKAAYTQAEGPMAFRTLALSSESSLCLGVINALNGYLSSAGLMASAAAAALGGGQIPNGYQKSSGGILLPAKAS